MFNITAKYCRVWQVDTKGKYVSVDLSTSKKNQDGTYTNSSWKGVKFVGKSVDMARTLQKGDTVDIKSGMLGKREYQGKWYDDIIVFEFELVRKNEKPSEENQGGFVPVDIESDMLPF